MKYWWPTVVWAAVIFGFSSKPTLITSHIYWQDFVVKKIAHLFVYAVLAVLLYRSLKHTTKLNKTYLLLFTITITTLYALSDEFHQSFTPGREPRLRDVAIDVVGAITGLNLTLKLYPATI